LLYKIVSMIPMIYHMIFKYFPSLSARIKEIKDVRKKPEYELTEIIMAGIAMFIFKDGILRPCFVSLYRKDTHMCNIP